MPGLVALSFDAASANNQYAILLGSNRAAESLWFTAAVGADEFVFSGGVLTVGAGGIVNQDTESQRFDSTLVTAADQTWTAGFGGLNFHHVSLEHTLTLAGPGALSLAGSLTLTADRTLTNDSSGSVTLNRIVMPADRTLTVAGAGGTEVTGVMEAGALIKQGSGSLTLSGANTYTGATTVSGGMLVATNAAALGTVAGGTTVTAGGTLALQGGITINGESLSLAGSGTAGTGALHNISGTNTWNGTVSLADHATITSVEGTLIIGQNPGPRLPQAQTMALGAHTLTVDTIGGDVRVESNLTGLGGNLVKTGSSTLSLGGLANNHTGTTSVLDGTLRLFTVHEPATPPLNVGLLGAIVIGDNLGDAGSASLVFGLPEQAFVSGHRIRDNAALRINRDGLFDTSGASEVVGAITFQGGEIVTRGGMLGVTNNLTALASEREASISGPGSLNLGDVVRTITTAAGARLRIDSVVTDGGLIKTGEGHLGLSGQSTYRGETQIRQGTVTIASDAALGSTVGGTSISAGAALQLQNGLTSGESVTVQGSGIGNTGAIRNLSGVNTLTARLR